MKNFFLAEKLKNRHTVLTALAVIMPLVSVLFAARLTHEYFAVDSFNWWYMTFYPGIIGILCGMIGGKDRKMKNRAVLSLPCDLGKIWDARILLGAAISGLSVLCLTAMTVAVGKGMELALHVTFVMPVSVKTQLAAGLLIWLTSLWQIPFCLLLLEKTGFFPMFMIHLLTYVAAAAGIALESWFAAVPGAITARLMCVALGVLPNGLPAVEGMVTFSPEVIKTESLWVGIPAAILWFLCLWVIGRKCFERQVSK